MRQQNLGTNGPLVSAQGLGCMGMSISYGEPNDEESIATIHRALDLGVNLIVTSDAYEGGVNEELVGRALKGKRSRALIATKFGNLRLGIGYMAYSPLGRGIPDRRHQEPGRAVAKDRRHDHPRFNPDNFRRNVALLDPIEKIAARRKCTPAQVALAWVHAQGDDIVPIPGTKRRSYLEQDVAALDITFSNEEVDALTRAFPIGATAGNRYPGKQMRTVGI